MSTYFVVYLVITVTVLISYKGFKNTMFFESYKFQIKKIRYGEKFRMITSAFLHADYTHLLFNMLSLFFFGPIVSSYLGVFNFLLIYFWSLLAGNLVTYIYHKNDLYYSAIGASGGVSGIIFSAILFYPKIIIYMPFPMPGYLYAVIYLGYSIFGMKKKLGNIGHSAHIGGSIGGYLLTIILRPDIINTNTVFVIFLAVIITGLFIYEKFIK